MVSKTTQVGLDVDPTSLMSSIMHINHWAKTYPSRSEPLPQQKTLEGKNKKDPSLPCYFHRVAYRLVSLFPWATQGDVSRNQDGLFIILNLEPFSIDTQAYVNFCLSHYLHFFDLTFCLYRQN